MRLSRAFCQRTSLARSLTSLTHALTHSLAHSRGKLAPRGLTHEDSSLTKTPHSRRSRSLTRLTELHPLTRNCEAASLTRSLTNTHPRAAHGAPFEKLTRSCEVLRSHSSQVNPSQACLPVLTRAFAQSSLTHGATEFTHTQSTPTLNPKVVRL